MLLSVVHYAQGTVCWETTVLVLCEWWGPGPDCLSGSTTDQLAAVWLPNIWPWARAGLGFAYVSWIAALRLVGEMHSNIRTVPEVACIFQASSSFSDVQQKPRFSLENILCTSTWSLQGYGGLFLVEGKVLPYLERRIPICYNWNCGMDVLSTKSLRSVNVGLEL